MHKFIFPLFLFQVLISSAQHTGKPKGFYNAKYLISAEMIGHIPFVYNRTKDDYIYSKYDADLKEKTDRFNYGFRISAGKIISRQFIFSLEGGVDFSHVYLPMNKSIPGVDDFNSIKMTFPSLSVRTYSFMPKFEVASKKALMPMGFSCQFGLGLSLSQVIDKNYAAKASVYHYETGEQTFNVNPSYMAKHFYKYDTDLIKSLTFLYAFSIRTALSKKLLLDYGVRYTLNMAFDRGTIKESSQYIISESEMKHYVQNQQFLSIIRLNVGVTYVLGKS